MWKQVHEILNQAATRIKSGIVAFLPGLLALAVVLVVAVALAWIARAMIRRSLRRLEFDKRVEQWGFTALAGWSPARSPSLLLAGLAYWSIVLIGLLMGLSALDARVTSLLVMRLLEYLPNVLAAGLILMVGALIARFLARGVLISAVNMQIHSARLLSLGVKWLVLVLSGAMALDHLGIGGPIVRMSFGILFGGIVLALSLAVGLGSKDMVSRSLERQAGKTDEDATASRLHQL
jgi:hypothetical protein